MHSRTKTCCLTVIVLTAAGCADQHRFHTATDFHMERMDEVRNTPPAHLMQMADNALLQDMSIADFHFAGHSTELSGTGAARLNRMSPLLSTYGGTVRYDTKISDEKFLDQRLNHVKEYLATTGCDMSRVEITTGMSAGTGIPARRAIEIDFKGTAKPEASGGSAQAMSAVTAPSSKSGS